MQQSIITKITEIHYMQIILKPTIKALQELSIGQCLFSFLDTGKKALFSVAEKSERTITFRQTHPAHQPSEGVTLSFQSAASSFFFLCSQSNGIPSSAAIETAIVAGINSNPKDISHALNCSESQASTALCWNNRHPELNTDGFDLTGINVDRMKRLPSFVRGLCVTMEKEYCNEVIYYTGDINAIYDQCAQNKLVKIYEFTE
jgi:hypothetical protein